VAHFVSLLFEGSVGRKSFRCILCFSFCKRLIGLLLLRAIRFMDCCCVLFVLWIPIPLAVVPLREECGHPLNKEPVGS